MQTWFFYENKYLGKGSLFLIHSRIMAFVSSEPTCELKRAVEGFIAKCICLLSVCILNLLREIQPSFFHRCVIQSSDSEEKGSGRKTTIRENAFVAG